MKIDWVKHLVVTPTLGVWKHKNRGTPPQQARIDEFCNTNRVQTRYVGDTVPESQHDMITLLFSKQKFVTVEHIDKCLNQSLMYANKFLHLSVNKFLVYSVANKTEHLDIDDLDQRLVAHWISVVNKDVVYVEYNSNDRGYLGNWEYPITNIIWRLHD